MKLPVYIDINKGDPLTNEWVRLRDALQDPKTSPEALYSVGSRIEELEATLLRLHNARKVLGTARMLRRRKRVIYGN
jgi:hypothetical protein